MNYRERIAPLLHGRSFLDVALDVHTTTIGSFDRSEQEQESDVSLLKGKIDHWEAPIHSHDFDGAVRSLILTVLNEYFVAQWADKNTERKQNKNLKSFAAVPKHNESLAKSINDGLLAKKIEPQDVLQIHFPDRGRDTAYNRSAVVWYWENIKEEDDDDRGQ